MYIQAEFDEYVYAYQTLVIKIDYNNKSMLLSSVEIVDNAYKTSYRLSS